MEQTKLESRAWVGNGFWAGNITLHPREVGIQGQLSPFTAITTIPPCQHPPCPHSPTWVTAQQSPPGWTGSLTWAPQHLQMAFSTSKNKFGSLSSISCWECISHFWTCSCLVPFCSAWQSLQGFEYLICFWKWDWRALKNDGFFFFFFMLRVRVSHSPCGGKTRLGIHSDFPLCSRQCHGAWAHSSSWFKASRTLGNAENFA